jgi:hypothetical protein
MRDANCILSVSAPYPSHHAYSLHLGPTTLVLAAPDQLPIHQLKLPGDMQIEWRELTDDSISDFYLADNTEEEFAV